MPKLYYRPFSRRQENDRHICYDHIEQDLGMIDHIGGFKVMARKDKMKIPCFFFFHDWHLLPDLGLLYYRGLLKAHTAFYICQKCGKLKIKLIEFMYENTNT
jgi:hypothetical protein